MRLWGTIGWIAASWPFVFILVDWAKVPAFGAGPFIDWLGDGPGHAAEDRERPSATATSYTFLAAGIASLLLAAFSLVLPHTPPKPATERPAKSSPGWRR